MRFDHKINKDGTIDLNVRGWKRFKVRLFLTERLLSLAAFLSPAPFIVDFSEPIIEGFGAGTELIGINGG